MASILVADKLHASNEEFGHTLLVETFLKMCTDVAQKPRCIEEVQQNAIQLTFDILKQSPQQRRIQDAAVYMLGSLARAGTTVARDAIAQDIAVLLATMPLRPGDVGLQVGTCDTIAHLCDAGLAAKLLDSDAAEVTIQIMRQHRENGALQLSGCKALRGLMALPKGRSKVLRGGGVEAVLAAMQAHPDSPALQHFACTALHSICAVDYLAPKVIRLGTVEIVLDAMKRLSGIATVQEAACRALSLLSSLDAAQKAMIAANGIQTVVSIMAEHTTSLAVQRDGCKILWQLSSNKANVARVLDADGRKAALDATRLFSGDNDVPYYAQLTLRNINAIEDLAAIQKGTVVAVCVPTQSARCIPGVPDTRQ